MQKPMVFPSTSSGATVGYSYEKQKANKTYKCNDLEVCSTLSQQLRRRCRCCTRDQSSATRCKYRINYLWIGYGFLGCGGPPTAEVPASTTALPPPMASLA